MCNPQQKQECYLQMREIQDFWVLLHLLLHEAEDEEAHPSSPGRAGNAAPPNLRNGGDWLEKAGNRAIIHFLFSEPMLCVTTGRRVPS